jgi:hypothetical protein
MPKMSGMHMRKSSVVDLSVFPSRRQLHVVLHGLVCVRLSACDRTATLHVPNVTSSGGMRMGHIYRVGSYCDLRDLPVGHDFCLQGVQMGDLDPATKNMKDTFLSICIRDIQTALPSCEFRPHGTRTTVTLPWPSDIRRVRLLKKGPRPLYSYANGTRPIDPQKLGYISYLTYDLDPTDRPALVRGAQLFWQSDALTAHTRLHFFGDPPTPMNEKMFKMHVAKAYSDTGSQLFQPALDLVANTSSRPKWHDPDPSSPDIPVDEQRDLTDARITSDVGNCDGVYVLD